MQIIKIEEILRFLRQSLTETLIYALPVRENSIEDVSEVLPICIVFNLASDGAVRENEADGGDQEAPVNFVLPHSHDLKEARTW